MAYNIMIAASLAICTAGPLLAQTVLNGDHVITGSLCTGGTCPASLSFGSVDLQIDDMSPILSFEDKSAVPSPNNDYAFFANPVGTENSFSLMNLSTGTNLLYLSGEVTAPGLHLNGDGELGIGTALPESELHIVGGRAVAIIMENNEFDKWDMSAGVVGFAINDYSNSSTPVVLENGGRSGSLWVKTDGKVGMGTSSPETALHLRRSDGTGAMLIEEQTAGTLGQLTLRNNGITFFSLEDTSIADAPNTGRKWNFQNQAGTFRVTTAPGGPGEIEMIMTPAGDMTIKGTLTTGGGTCGGGCDAVFSDGYDLPSITEHAEAMWSLGHLPNVGQTVENAPINVSDKLGRMLNELEHAHIYIDHLHTRLADEADRNASQQAQIEALMARIDALEDG